MIEFREYQQEIINTCYPKLMSYGWVYLAMEVRTGKTLTSLGICQKLGGNQINVLFITKKKAITSIESDVELLKDNRLKVKAINYESLHKIGSNKIDVIIIDEAHRLGGYPKPAKAAKQIKEIKNNNTHSKVIFLSGTPTPESWSQIYHQLWILDLWEESNFYKWAKNYVNITQRFVAHGNKVNDYSDANFEKIDNVIHKSFFTFTQKEAGFKSEIKETFVTVQMKPITKRIIKEIKEHKLFKGKENVILADTGAKEMSKVHQLSSGTCILDEPQQSIVIDSSKLDFIIDNFNGRKFGIFYKFKHELELLKTKLDITQDIEEFNNTDKIIALQFVSGREGTNLSKAEFLIYFNVDFSATTYWQTRDRMTTKDREESEIIYLISDCGIEKEIIEAVKNKETYTTKHYERARLPEKNTERSGAKGMVRNKIDKNKQERNTGSSGTKTQQSLFS